MEARTLLGGAVLVLGVGAILYVAVTPEQALPVNRANGSYASACCGVMVLKDGVMNIGKRAIGYTIQKDKVGAYVLPNIFIGEGQTAFRIDRNVPPLKLRLDNVDRPRVITLDRSSPANLLKT